MTTSEKIAQLLKEDEGWSPYVYKDTLGFDTIGYGFLVDARKGQGLPKTIAEAWLIRLITDDREELLTRLPWIEDQPENVQIALSCMCYQLGINGLVRFQRMLKALFDGDREQAAFEALNSKWASQTPERAKRMAKLLRD